MKWLINLILILPFLQSVPIGYSFWADNVSTLYATGDHKVTRPKALDNDAVDSINIKALKEARLQAEKNGYLDATIEIDQITDFASEVDANINMAVLYRLRKIIISFKGDSLEDLKYNISSKFEDKPASEKNIRALLQKIPNLYSENGFPFAQSKLIAAEKIPPDTLNLSIEIVSGPFVQIDSLKFLTEGRISYSFLKRKSGLHKDLPFSQERIDNSLESINSLQYLKITQPPEEQFYNNHRSCLLIYDINSLANNRLEGALGYNPASGNTDGFLFGFVDLAFYNPFGDGKSFFIQWDKPNVSSSRLALKFDYPYPLGIDLESSLKIANERFSDYYLSLSASLDIYRNLNPQNRLELGLKWEKISAQGEIFRSVFDSRIYRASAGLTLSSFKTGTFPPFGRKFSAKLSYLHKKLYPTLGQSPQDNSIDPFMSELMFQLGLRLSSHLFSDIRLNFKGFSEDESLISPAEMIRLGGRYTLRGYSEEQFLTPRASWFNLELGAYKKGLFKSYLFTDFGYARLSDIYNTENIPEFKDRFLYGYGLGFKLFSGQTGLDFNLGWNRDDNLEQGKLYLILENNF